MIKYLKENRNLFVRIYYAIPRYNTHDMMISIYIYACSCTDAEKKSSSGVLCVAIISLSGKFLFNGGDSPATFLFCYFIDISRITAVLTPKPHPLPKPHIVCEFLVHGIFGRCAYNWPSDATIWTLLEIIIMSINNK